MLKPFKTINQGKTIPLYAVLEFKKKIYNINYLKQI